MRPATLLRLALAGTRTDTARVALTALAALLATLSLLAAVTVIAIRPPTGEPPFGDVNVATGVREAMFGYAYQYTNNLLVEPGLRPGLAFALLLLCIPVLALAGQCARLGAPARDRRLAAIRLAGATPRQAAAIAVAETATAAAIGAAGGVAVYLAGRVILHRPDPLGRLPLPTDVRLAPWLMVLVAAALPLLAAAFAALLLRRVAFTPFGVVRQQQTGRPGWWPGILIAVGVAAFASAEPVEGFHQAGRGMPGWLIAVLMIGGAAVAAVGVVLGTGWISYATGRVLHRLARRPAALVAARRLLADPWSGGRALAALLLCVTVGAGAAGMRALFTAEFTVWEARNQAWAAAQGEEYLAHPDDYAFYYRALDLVNAAVGTAMVVASLGLLVFLVEGIASRRRAYASLVATGVPRSVLARVTGWQALAPAVPAILLALAVGAVMPRGLAREIREPANEVPVCSRDWDHCWSEDSPYLSLVPVPELVQPVAVPVAELAVVAGVALAAVLVTVGIGLLFLRPSTEVSELRTG